MMEHLCLTGQNLIYATFFSTHQNINIVGINTILLSTKNVHMKLFQNNFCTVYEGLKTQKE